MSKYTLSQIKRFIADGVSARAKYMNPKTGWPKAAEHYLQKPYKTGGTKNKLRVPLTFSLVETYSSIMINRPPALMTSRLWNGKWSNAEYSRVLVEYFLSTDHNMSVLKMAAKNAALYGTAIVKPTWDYREKFIEKEIVVPDLSGTKDVVTQKFKIKEVISDKPIIRVIGLKDFTIDPTAEYIDEARWAAENYWLTPEEVSTMLSGYGVKKKASDISPYGAGDGGDSLNIPDVPGKNYSESTQIMCQITEFYDSSGDIYIILNGTELMYSGAPLVDFGRIPYVAFRVNRPPGSFYGLGLAIPIMSLQEENDKRRSQRADNLDLLLNKPLGVRVGSPAWTWKGEFSRGARIPYNQPDDIFDFPFSDYTQTAVQDESIIRSDAQNAVGISDYTAGMAREGMNKTASGFLQATQNSMTRVDDDLRTMERDLIAPVAERFHILCKEMLSESEDIWIRDQSSYDEDYLIRKSDIECRVDFTVQHGSSSSVSNDLKRQNFMVLMQFFSQPQFMQALAQTGYMVRFEQLAKAGLEVLGESRPDLYIAPIQPGMPPLSEINEQQPMVPQQAQGGINGQ